MSQSSLICTLKLKVEAKKAFVGSVDTSSNVIDNELEVHWVGKSNSDVKVVVVIEVTIVVKTLRQG